MRALREGTFLAHLKPSQDQFGFWLIEEAPDIGSAETDTAQSRRQAHGQGKGQGTPRGVIIARPDGRVALHAREMRPGQDEGS